MSCFTTPKNIAPVIVACFWHILDHHITLKGTVFFLCPGWPHPPKNISNHGNGSEFFPCPGSLHKRILSGLIACFFPTFWAFLDCYTIWNWLQIVTLFTHILDHHAKCCPVIASCFSLYPVSLHGKNFPTNLCICPGSGYQRTLQ